MGRDVGNNDVVTALESRKVRTCHLYEISVFNTAENRRETIYGTDYAYDIFHNGIPYSAVGYLLNISGLEEFNDSRIATVTVQLSGVAETLIGTLLSYEYLDQPLIIKRAFINETGVTIPDADEELEELVSSPQLIDEPVVIFEGGIERPQINESQESGYVIVSIQASSRFSEFLLHSGRHTNPQEQKFYDPSDRFFDQVGRIDKNLVWGLDS
tara:strand:- start:7659 stop:8297 length:639 start_codon:yes stop_codon:yes gene_type:complete